MDITDDKQLFIILLIDVSIFDCVLWNIYMPNDVTISNEDSKIQIEYFKYYSSYENVADSTKQQNFLSFQ